MTDELHTMNVKHSIDIPGLPDGWRAVAYRLPSGSDDEYALCDDGSVEKAKYINFPCLILEKIQPRRIVLEETKEKSSGSQILNCGYAVLDIDSKKIWRVVEG